MRSLGTAMQALIQSLGIGRRIREYDAVEEWERIVGEQIARVTEAKSIKQGLLVVRVNNGPWRNELQLRKQEIIGKLNGALGENVVSDIHFV
jgi:predicted nucleic acid-binding Zn ribbon protein